MIAPTDDAELLRRYAEKHSEAAFRELAGRYLNLVYRSALRQTGGDPHRAEDIAQAVFTQLARKAGSLVRHPNLVGWLYLTTHYITSSSLRAERRRRRRETEAQLMQAGGEAGEPADDWAGVRPVLDAAMRDLRPADRDAILLRFFAGCPFAEVGSRLSLSEDAARMRVGRALEKLRAALSRHGVVSTSTALALMIGSESAAAAPASLAAAVAASAAAVAAVGAAPSTGILPAIWASKLALGAAALAGIVAAGAAFHYGRQIRAANADVLAWEARADAAQARFDAGHAKLRRAIAAAGNSRPSRGAAQRAIAGPITEDLQLQRLRDRQARANFILNYGPFLRSLGLTTLQAQQLADAELQEKSAMNELRAIARLAGIELESDPVLTALARQISREREAAEVRIAGASNLRALRAYLAGQDSLQTGEARYLASQVAALAWEAGSPITPAERAEVARLIEAHSPHYEPGDDTGMATIEWRGLLAQAGPTLPAAEVAALEALQADVAKNLIQKQALAAAAHSPR